MSATSARRIQVRDNQSHCGLDDCEYTFGINTCFLVENMSESIDKRSRTLAWFAAIPPLLLVSSSNLDSSAAILSMDNSMICSCIWYCHGCWIFHVVNLRSRGSECCNESNIYTARGWDKQVSPRTILRLHRCLLNGAIPVYRLPRPICLPTSAVSRYYVPGYSTRVQVWWVHKKNLAFCQCMCASLRRRSFCSFALIVSVRWHSASPPHTCCGMSAIWPLPRQRLCRPHVCSYLYVCVHIYIYICISMQYIYTYIY